MTATAKFQSFGPFFLNGNIVTAPHIFHYTAGTSTLKDAYADRGKLATVAQPLVGDANGLASAYWDGLYKLIVKTSDEATILATWDGVQLIETITSAPGTWTPTLSCVTPGDLSLSYTYRQGEIIQIGDLTWLSGNLICTPTYTTATGAVRITGATYGHDGNVTPVGCCTIVNAAGVAAYKSHSATIDTENLVKINKVSHDVFTPLNITDFTSAAEIWIYFAILYRGV